MADEAKRSGRPASSKKKKVKRAPTGATPARRDVPASPDTPAIEGDTPQAQPSIDAQIAQRNIFFRGLYSLALVSARRPITCVIVAILLTVAAIPLILKVKISTSRTDLVSASNPNQRKLLEFYKTFGYPDDPVVIVSGDTPEARRAYVDQLVEKFEAIPELEGRVLARITPEIVAEVALLQAPTAVVSQLEKLGVDPASLKPTIEGGLPAWIQAFQRRVDKQATEAPTSEKETTEGLAQAANLVRALDDEVMGRPVEERFKGMMEGAKTGAGPMSRPAGIDELGYLTGTGDHQIIALFPIIQGDEADQVSPLVNKIRAARDEVKKANPNSKVEANVTGVPALATDEHDIVKHDLVISSILSALGIAASLLFAFRSIRQASVSFLPIGFGTAVTWGLAYLAFGQLNLITASFTSVLLGLGDFGVHIQARYAELMRGGTDRKVAIETALVKAGPGLLVGTVTTAAAFFTTTVTEFTAFAQLGLLTCLGLLVMLCGTYLLIAPMTILILGKKPKVAPEMPGMRAMGRLIRRFPKALVVASVVLTAGFACFLGGVTFNGRYFDLLPKDAESAKGLVEIEKDRVLTPITANVSADSIEEAREVAAKLRALGSVASVESPSDLLPPLDEASRAALKKTVSLFDGPLDLEKLGTEEISKEQVLPKLNALADSFDEIAFAMKDGGKDTKAVDDVKDAIRTLKKDIETLPEGAKEKLTSINHRAAALLKAQLGEGGIARRAIDTARRVVERGHYAPEDLPPLWQRRFVSKDGTKVALFVHPKDDIWDVKISEHFAKEINGATPNASGLAMTLSEHPRMIVEGFRNSTIVAAGLVLVILFVSFRRLTDMAVAAVPLAMGAIWMLGSMGPLDVSFNHANMVVLPLLLGLGVDAGVHIMVRYRQSAADHGGVADIDEMLTSTGGAVFVASMTTIFGFAVMVIANYRGMVKLGVIMTVGMSATLALTLIIIPAILILLKKAR